MCFLALSGRESSLVQTFCESCVHLDITHPSVYMTRRFVIQGCPTLNGIAQFVLQRVITGMHTIQQQVLSTFLCKIIIGQL